MQQLTGLDAFFLALDTAHSTGHVGGVSCSIRAARRSR